MPRTLQQIKKDFLSFKKLLRTTPGATIFVEKYLEDVGSLLQMVEPRNARVISEDTKPEVRKSKAKTPKAE